MNLNINYIILIGVFFLSLSNEIPAQILITGTVKDTETKEPMVGVSVVIKEIQQGTITDNNGKYSISVHEGNYTVCFSFISYEMVEKHVSCTLNQSKHLLNVSLNPSTLNLNEVTVTVRSKARQIREKAMPISVISMKELNGTVSGVGDVLSKTSGVTIRSTGGVGSSSRISVRGLEGKRIGLFVNESSLNENSDYMDINDIPVDLIKRIEVYKGIVPAKFGGSAIGGAVNIVLKEYPPKYLDINYSLQSFNTHKASFALKRNRNRIVLGLGTFYTYSDNSYKMLVPNHDVEVTREHDNYEKFIIPFSITSYKWWFDEVEFAGLPILSSKEIQGIEEYDIRHAASTSNAYVIEANANKENFLTEGMDFDIDNQYTYSVYTLTDTSRYRYGWAGEITEAVSQDGIGLGEIGMHPNTTNTKKHIYFQKLNLNYVINHKNSFNLNSHYRYSKGLPSDTLKDAVVGYKTEFNSTMNSWTLGLSYEFNSEDNKLTNATSVKYYHYSVQTQLIEITDVSRIPEDIDNLKKDYGVNNAIRYRFTPTFLMKASASYDVRLPSEYELLGDGFMIGPAGNLYPERSTAFNIGAMYDKTTARNNRFQIEINGFYQYLENMIRFTGGALQNRYKNFGKMHSLGAETEVKWDAAKWLYLWGNVTYQDLRDVRELTPGTQNRNPTYMDRMPNIPWLFANGGIELHRENLFGGNAQNTRLFGDCSFIEEYFHDFEQSIFQEKRIPRSLTFNAGLEHSLKNQRIIISVWANNITNARVMSEFNRPLPGRNFGVKLRYILK